MELFHFLIDKVPGGLSRPKWQGHTNQSGSQDERQPDPRWTSYRGKDHRSNSYGSDSSDGTRSLPISASAGMAKPETPSSSDVSSALGTSDRPPHYSDTNQGTFIGGNLPPRFRNKHQKQGYHEMSRRQGQDQARNYGSGLSQKIGQRKLMEPVRDEKSPQSEERSPQDPNLVFPAKMAEKQSGGSHVSVPNPWREWERSVVIQGALSEEDMAEIGVVEDNDDINDVFVNAYVNALHKEDENPGQKDTTQLQLTPSKIQQLSKLKSTTNADSVKVPPGTMPNAPKGLDRWGGTELRNSSPSGWGDVDDSGGNWYDDGASAWGSGSSTAGWN